MAAPGQLSFYRVVADPQQGSHALARGHQVGVGDAQPGLARGVQCRCHQRLHRDVPIAVAGRKAPGQILSLCRRPLAQLRLGGIGGLLGVLGGIGMSQLISKFMDTPTALSVPAILVAVVFSVLIGLIFGLVPAVKASKLNPIEALRRE